MNFSHIENFNNKVFHTITDRFKGVSKEPYSSLNLALHVGDNPINVLENRELISQKHDFILENLIYMDQTHSSNIVTITDSLQNKIPNCDGIITNVKNIPLMVMVADCIPLLFFDSVKNVIAVSHAGRNGTFKHIAKKTVLKMKNDFSSNPSDILVGIGPSIHSCCYEVGSDIAKITTENFGDKYIEKNNFLDLQALNLDQLMEAGIKKENIETSSICTSCNNDYFSYRRDGTTGRFAGFMMIR